MKRIAINGFGRIGRMALRIISKRDDMGLVAINDIGDRDTMLHLLKYDSIHGRFDGKVEKTDRGFAVNGWEILVFSEKDPAKLPWKEQKIDIVLESTGLFLSAEKARAHIDAGAKKVLLSAPAKSPEIHTVVMGINHDTIKPDMNIISNASCTTNCLAPVVKMLDDAFGLKRGIMTTIHSYTNDQRILDLPHKDLRRARAAAMNMIPTTTGAARAVGKVLPHLNGKLDGIAIRVPTYNVSLVDLTAELGKNTTVEEVNAVAKKASETTLRNVLFYTDEPLVSLDFLGSPFPSNFDALSTNVIGGNFVKVFAWYDNEWGFTEQYVKLAAFVSV
ncbi:MAG: type I glyceraldehyde-3-phosphate dehydrogenase [Myxococcota bacterium]